jgi:hypothetical protein
VNESSGQKLWKRRAKSALGNPFGTSTFRTASTTTSLTIAIAFNKMQKQAFASLRGLIGSSRNIDRHQSGILIDFTGIAIGTD